MDIRVPTWELGVRYTVGNIEVGGGVRNFWRGVRKKGGSDEPPEPPLVTGLIMAGPGTITKLAQDIQYLHVLHSTPFTLPSA